MVRPVRALECICEGCRHRMVRMDQPRCCTRCKSPYWNTPRKLRQHGKPPIELYQDL
jgi:hypothetical protein